MIPRIVDFSEESFIPLAGDSVFLTFFLPFNYISIKIPGFVAEKTVIRMIHEFAFPVLIINISRSSMKNKVTL